MIQTTKEATFTVPVEQFTKSFRGHKRVTPGKPGRRRKEFLVTLTRALPASDPRVQKVLQQRADEAHQRFIRSRMQITAQQAESALSNIFTESVKKMLGREAAEIVKFEQLKKRKQQGKS